MRRHHSIKAAAILFVLAVASWLCIEFALLAPSDDFAQQSVSTEYRTIVSLSTVSDQFLLKNYPREKLLGISSYTHKQFEDQVELPIAIDSIRSVEQIVALRPQLVVLSNVGERENIRVLKQAGLRVLDLGPPGGINTYLQQLGKLEKLTGVRGVEVAETARVHSLRKSAPLTVNAIYIAQYSGVLYGAGGDSSYHDVIGLAGLGDAANNAKGYPEYSTEFVLAAEPDFIVTEAGMKEGICHQLNAASACRNNRICEIPPETLNDLGRGIIESAELLRFCVDSSYEN